MLCLRARASSALRHANHGQGHARTVVLRGGRHGNRPGPVRRDAAKGGAEAVERAKRRQDLTDLSEAVSRFGSVIVSRFATGAGEPEDLLRGPFEGLLGDLAAIAEISPVVVAESTTSPMSVCALDYAVHVAGALVGFAEIKAPGKGVDTARYRGHDKRQWERLSCLPNVLYTDGQSFALYRDGDRVGSVARLVGDVETSGTPA